MEIVENRVDLFNPKVLKVLMKIHSLRKSKKILLLVYHLFRRKRKRLLPAQVNEIQHDLKMLQEEILNKDREKASYLSLKCQDYGTGLLRKTRWEQIRDFIVALFFALAVALVIRQVWFELYEIPTGSMRPTFKEKDRLIVSKTDYGINIPFTSDHFYFDPDLVKRSGIIVFSVENLDVRDPDMLYFYVFPGKKQFVKRLMGRPGDTVYFYGGKIYGIDKEGKDISDQLQLKSIEKIDHVPFIRFEGNITVSEPYSSPAGNAYKMAIVYQMNEAVARLTTQTPTHIEGEMLFAPRIHNRNAPHVKNYYELWGMENYATVRIVRKEDIRAFAEKHHITLEEGKLYLELKHHPDLKHLHLGKDLHGRLRPQFTLSTSILPLDEASLKRLYDNLYTARFMVKNGFAKRYSVGGGGNIGSHNLTRLEGVPDGMYEFYYGQAYEIGWGGIAKKLGPEHPLSQFSVDQARKLFNYGIDFNKYLVMGPHFETGRFAYFRQGDFYLMGAPVFKKGDPVLEEFISRENKRKEEANPQNPYHPFVDQGPPLNLAGNIDADKIKQYGLLIPPDMYLALGDNFAMSSDSRDYGFVPQGNLRGGPSFIFWPPGDRFGPPPQPSYPWLTVPNGIVWMIALICFCIWYRVHRRHYRLPLKFDFS